MITCGNPILHRLGVTRFWQITDYFSVNRERFLNRFVLFAFIHKLFYEFHRKIRWGYFFDVHFKLEKLDIEYPDFFFDIYSKVVRFEVIPYLFPRSQKKKIRRGTKRRLIGYSEQKKRKFLYRRFLYMRKKNERRYEPSPLYPIMIPYFYMQNSLNMHVVGFEQQTLFLTGQLSLMLKPPFSYSPLQIFVFLFLQMRLSDFYRLSLEREWRWNYFRKVQEAAPLKRRERKWRYTRYYKQRLRKWVRKIRPLLVRNTWFGGKQSRFFWFAKWRRRQNFFELPEFYITYFRSTMLSFFSDLANSTIFVKRRFMKLYKRVQRLLVESEIRKRRFTILILEFYRRYYRYYRWVCKLKRHGRLKINIGKIFKRFKKTRYKFFLRLKGLVVNFKGKIRQLIQQMELCKQRSRTEDRFRYFLPLYSSVRPSVFHQQLSTYCFFMLNDKKRLLKQRLASFLTQYETYRFLIKFVWVLLFRQQFAKLAARALQEGGFSRIKWRFALFNRFKFSAKTFIWYLLNKLYLGQLAHKVFYYAKRSLDKICARRKYRGYKLCFAGRFTRRQIATLRWSKVGTLRPTDRASPIDFAFETSQTRHGAFGIKLWLGRPNLITLRIDKKAKGHFYRSRVRQSSKNDAAV